MEKKSRVEILGQILKRFPPFNKPKLGFYIVNLIRSSTWINSTRIITTSTAVLCMPLNHEYNFFNRMKEQINNK